MVHIKFGDHYTMHQTIVQQGMNHDKPYYLNMSSVNMLIFMTNYYTFL